MIGFQFKIYLSTSKKFKNFGEFFMFSQQMMHSLYKLWHFFKKYFSKTSVSLIEHNVKFVVMWSPGEIILQYAEEGVLQIKNFNSRSASYD